jgi:hypothetical protein
VGWYEAATATESRAGQSRHGTAGMFSDSRSDFRSDSRVPSLLHPYIYIPTLFYFIYISTSYTFYTHSHPAIPHIGSDGKRAREKAKNERGVVVLVDWRTE